MEGSLISSNFEKWSLEFGIAVNARCVRCYQ